jgi:hypothetical protein
MGDRDDIREGEEPGLDDVTATLEEETPGADDNPGQASPGLREEGDEYLSDNPSGETSQERPA